MKNKLELSFSLILLGFELADVLLNVFPDFVHLRAFIIAEQKVDDFKSGEEGSQRGEAKVVYQSRSTSLVNEVAVELGEPAAYVQYCHLVQ